MCQSPFVNSSSFKSEGMSWLKGGVFFIYCGSTVQTHVWFTRVYRNVRLDPTVDIGGRCDLSKQRCPVLSCHVCNTDGYDPVQKRWFTMKPSYTVYSLLWPCSWCYRRCRSSAYLNLGMRSLLILYLSLLCLQNTLSADIYLSYVNVIEEYLVLVVCF